MSAYLIRRLGQSLIVLLGISVVVFVILHLTGDPTLLMLPPDVSAEEVARFRKAMGFDDPLAVQYWRFLRGALRGDFGNSLRHDEPALALVWQRMPATLELTMVAMAIALVLAIPAGIVSAVQQITGRGGEFATVSARDLSAADLEALLRRTVEETGARVVFTDLQAGSCTMAARKVLRGRDDVVLVVGANLPMLVDFVFADQLSPTDAARHALERGKAAIAAITGTGGGRQ